MNIELEIDELILEGVSPDDGLSVGDAVRRELANLLAERGMPHSRVRGVGAQAIDGGAIHARPGMSPVQIGRRLAAAVYNSLEMT